MTSYWTPLLLLLFSLASQAAPQQDRPPERASLEGVVLKSGSGEPLSRAEIKLIKVRSEKEQEEADGFIFGEGPEANAPRILTGADGKFSFLDVEPGQYRVSAERNGYVGQTYGRKKEGGQGTIFDLQPGQPTKDLVFRMVQGGVITGRVRDSLGEPLPGLTVTLAKVAYGEDGKKVLRQAKDAYTDDRGEYRLYWVEPGRYYVRVSQRSTPYGEVVNDRVIPPVYYPGLMTPDNAAIVEILPGVELSAIDVVMPQTSSYVIRGRVVDSATGKPPKTVSIQISPKMQEGLVLEFDFAQHYGRYDAATGTFEIRDVLPGTYWVTASIQSNFNAPISAERLADVRTGQDLFRAAFETTSLAEVAVDVRTSNINDVVLSLTGGVVIPIRVSVEGQELSTIKDFDSIRVNLSSKNADYHEGTRLNAEGAAKIDGVHSGEYKVNVNLGTKELYVKDVRYGRTGGPDEAIEISDQSPQTLTVLLSPKGGQIEGNLVDTLSQPATGAVVVLVPDDRDNPRLYKEVHTDHKGHFIFRALPPGGYKVFSWEDLDPRAYYDKEVISKYETQGRPVRLQESSKETVDLKLIAAPKP